MASEQSRANEQRFGRIGRKIDIYAANASANSSCVNGNRRKAYSRFSRGARPAGRFKTAPAGYPATDLSKTGRAPACATVRLALSAADNETARAAAKGENIQTEDQGRELRSSRSHVNARAGSSDQIAGGSVHNRYTAAASPKRNKYRRASPILVRTTKRNYSARGIRTATKFAAARSGRAEFVGRRSLAANLNSAARNGRPTIGSTSRSCAKACKVYANPYFSRSAFPPAWRNWQTRWTQNPVIARSCGFEPLRRHPHVRGNVSSLNI